MLILLTIFSSSFVIALSGALMPGPLLTVTVSESVNRGPKVGPLMIFGHGILELLLVTALLAGLAPVLRLPQMFIAVSAAGGIVLLWMGVDMLRSLPRLTLITHANQSERKNLVVAGIILSLINPYWLIWWATIGMGYIIQSVEFGILGVCAFFLGHILADLGWYYFVSYSVSKGKRLLNDRYYRFIIGCCSVILLIFSGYFFYSTFIKLSEFIS